MARLFVKHEPVECFVHYSVGNVKTARFRLDLDDILRAGLDIENNSLDVFYICFVDSGKCWAARTFGINRIFGRKVVLFSCIPFNNDPSGQKMILADMLLG